MLEELRRHNAIVQERIMKSFGYSDTEDFIQKGEDDYDLEKAHQDGDMHPNGKWVWVSSANGGKGDWRTLNGRAHKKHTDTQASNKFLENFKDASDDVLNKIVSGKIQAVDRERKLAQQILDSRKKKSIKSGTSTNDLLSTKINLSVKDFKIEELDDEYGDFKNAPLKLHEYVGKSVEYYDENGKKQKATPFINEFYASSKQDKVGGYEIRFNRADPIGTFKTLNEAVTALNNWMNKMRVPGHGKPKWIYNQSKGDYQMNYSLDVPYEKSKANNVPNSQKVDLFKKK